MVFAFILTCLLGAGVYTMADKVTIADKQFHDVQDKIADEQDGLRVLHAEWTFLTNPQRLEKIATEHFQLAPSDGRQYVEIAAIPTREFIEQQQKGSDNQVADNGVKTGEAKAGPVSLPHTAAKLPPIQATQVSAEMRDE
jgi:cell division protein FtsL